MKTFTQRTATTFATLALAASGALVATAPAHATTTPEAPAPATFTSVKVAGLKSKYTLTSKNKSYKFTVNITGTAADTSHTDTNGDGRTIRYSPYGERTAYPTVSVVKSSEKINFKPSISYPNTLKSGKNTFKLEVKNYTSPGVYKITIPVRQTDSTTYPSVSTYKYVTKKVTINANSKISKKETTLSAPSWKNGQTAKITFRAPEYQAGARVTLYVKKKGAKKYVKHTSKKLKRSYSSSQVLLKGKNLRPGDKIYFKVAKAKYAPAYKTAVRTIKKVR